MVLLPTRIFVDTNVPMNPKFNCEDYEIVYISIVSIEELDGLKKSESVGHLAREAMRKLNSPNVQVLTDYDFSLTNRFLEHKNDNLILGFAHQLYTTMDNTVIFLTDDLNVYIKAFAFKIPCEMFDFKEENNLYKGYQEITFNDFELASFYQTPVNRFGLLTNEYLIIKDESGQIVDKQRWDGNKFTPLTIYRKDKKDVLRKEKKDKFDVTFIEEIKPRNVQQELAFDLFQNPDITVKIIYGKYGSGKDLIMATHAISMIEKGIYDKLIFVRNNYQVKNSKDIGFLPGSANDKLMVYAMPLADHVGGLEGLYKLIDEGTIEIQHLGFIRGRDIKRSIVYCTEAENMTKEHIQLLIGRLSEGSVLWLNGDFKQVDHTLFERNSGLRQTIERLKGQELFGCVELSITERSKTAQLADLLD